MMKPRKTSFPSHLLFNSPSLLWAEYNALSVTEICLKYNTNRYAVYYNLRKNGFKPFNKSQARLQAQKRGVSWHSNKEMRDEIIVKVSDSLKEYWADDKSIEHKEKLKKNIMPKSTRQVLSGPIRYHIAKALKEMGFNVKINVTNLWPRCKHMYPIYIPEANLIIDIFSSAFWMKSKKYGYIRYRNNRKPPEKKDFIYMTLDWMSSQPSSIIISRIKVNVVPLIRSIIQCPPAKEDRIISIVFNSGSYERKLRENIDKENSGTDSGF